MENKTQSSLRFFPTKIYPALGGVKFLVGIDSPCVNFLTEISPGPALAVFAFRALPSNKNIAADFES